MKFQKAILTFSLFLNIFFGILIYQFTRPGTPKEFYINNAEFSSTNFPMSIDEVVKDRSIFQGEGQKHPVQWHWIKEGAGTVLGVREISGGPIDTRGYKKITIWIRDLKQGEYNFGDRNNIIAYYTSGSADWFERSMPFSVEITKGSLNISSVSNTRIYANAVFELNEPTFGKLENRKYFEVYYFKKIEYSELTPWLGKQGKGLLDELQ